jgi:hypothetical protein
MPPVFICICYVVKYKIGHYAVQFDRQLI